MADKKTQAKQPVLGAEELAWLDSALGTGTYFAKLGVEGARREVPSLSLKAYAKGVEFVKEGEKGGDVFVLYKGSAGAARKKFIGSKALATFSPGEFFGEVGFLVQTPRSATVEALEDSLAFSLKPADLQRVLSENPGVSDRLEATARERMSRLAES